ncbi:MAG: GDSL-type esterase/lipase family protein [Bacteroides sp.]|nr:GDSL-type esterase/lipase family protein [Bacteroides sp.]
MKKVSLLFVLLGLVLTLQAQEQVKVACVGNSITFGAGIENRARDSYPAVLGQLLGEKYEVRNFGVSGRTLLNKGDRPYMKEERFQEALQFDPDIVIIKLGTNDTKPQNWVYKADFKRDMITLIDAFRDLSSNPEVWLCYPATAYSAELGINDSIIVAGVIPVITEVAGEKGLRVIDLHSATADMEENFPDKIHPNEAGAKIMATAVYKALTGKETASVESELSVKEKGCKTKVLVAGLP